MSNLDESKIKTINKLHLIYMLIIAAIVVISILTISIWSNETAGIGLNNAATAASIVLAVVAIVITLVDVAGQRKGISEIRDSADTLQVTTKETENLLSNLLKMREDLEERLNALSFKSDEISENLERLQEITSEGTTDGNNKEEIEDIKKNINKLLNKESTSREFVNYALKQHNLPDAQDIQFLKEILDRIKVGEFSLIDILKLIRSTDESENWDIHKVKKGIDILVTEEILKKNNGRLRFI